MFYGTLVQPRLHAFSKGDPEIAHELVIRALASLSRKPYLLQVTKRVFRIKPDPRFEQEVFGLRFAHPVGLAAGFDKNCVALEALEALGFSFIEGGTIVRENQPGNPRPRIFRLVNDQALINRMGFPSDGVEMVKSYLANRAPIQVPLGLSIGKSKNTPLARAVEEYVELLDILYPYADYFVVNVSSPNTPGLRELQDKKYLKELLLALIERRTALTSWRRDARPKPILVKVSPDLTCGAIDELLDIVVALAIAGVIAVNTTIERGYLLSGVDEPGGLSGAPLRERAYEVIRYIHRRVPNLPIIGVGGVFTPFDIVAMFKSGASLVQIYTSFVYEGPSIVRNLMRGLGELMEREGVKHVSEFRR